MFRSLSGGWRSWRRAAGSSRVPPRGVPPCRSICSSDRWWSPRGVDSRRPRSDDVPVSPSPSSSSPSPLSAAGKYTPFRDESLVVGEAAQAERTPVYLDDVDEFEGLNLSRGVRGVFDVEDLVDVLRRENVKDIFVCAVPDEVQYVEYICIVTGKSARHLWAIAEFIRRLYKKKMHRGDCIPTIPLVDGKPSKDWIALDLGNIVLHIFTDATRRVYDLEVLWAIGREYDPQCQPEDDSLLKYAQKHGIHLSDLKPAAD